jgi:beta-galactosidase
VISDGQERYKFESAADAALSNRSIGAGAPAAHMEENMKLLYGTAYYEEYMPVEHLEKDMQMMEKAGLNMIRIAESTWSTEEPEGGRFDFSHVTRVLDAAARHGIGVVIGTPTYAIPAWMAAKYPDVLAVTSKGRGLYGARQIMDITDPDYLFHAERVIRKLMEAVSGYRNVIGFQIDNETKYYDTAGPRVQEKFVAYLKEKFHGSCEEMNKAYGLAYWSNSIAEWKDFPDVRGTVNASLAAEFDRFRRGLVEHFLSWQADIVNEYRRPDQFLTQNFDYEWRGYSFGLQPAVDHRKAARCLTLAGCDIYHPSEEQLTGAEISFCGDAARSLKDGKNYLVLETEAQGNFGWTPYPGQLRLQAYSHLASGACGVEYWHWHSIHNSAETYWKGILSHDLEENRIYREIGGIAKEWAKIGDSLTGLRKQNSIAILVSNDALTGLRYFPSSMESRAAGTCEYNDILRKLYDTLYRLNEECDLLWPDAEDFSAYKLVIVPALYACSDALLLKLQEYVKQGGSLLVTYRSAFADENLKVHSDRQPHILHTFMGLSYQEFVPATGESAAEGFTELLIPEGGKVLLGYDNPAWKGYAAAVENVYGEGRTFYLGCMLREEPLTSFLSEVLQRAGIGLPPDRFPVIVKCGRTSDGRRICFYFNYSGQTQHAKCRMASYDLLTGEEYAKDSELRLEPWGVAVTADGLRS